MVKARDIELRDVLLPAQFYVRSYQRTPWQELAAATLRQAVTDYVKSAKQPRWRREIRSWIADDSDRAQSFDRAVRRARDSAFLAELVIGPRT